MTTYSRAALAPTNGVAGVGFRGSERCSRTPRRGSPATVRAEIATDLSVEVREGSGRRGKRPWKAAIGCFARPQHRRSAIAKVSRRAKQ